MNKKRVTQSTKDRAKPVQIPVRAPQRDIDSITLMIAAMEKVSRDGWIVLEFAEHKSSEFFRMEISKVGPVFGTRAKAFERIGKKLLEPKNTSRYTVMRGNAPSDLWASWRNNTVRAHVDRLEELHSAGDSLTPAEIEWITRKQKTYKGIP